MSARGSSLIGSSHVYEMVLGAMSGVCGAECACFASWITHAPLHVCAQVILSKCDDGNKGEVEIGLMASGRLYARLHSPIKFSPPPFLVAKEAFTLCFEVGSSVTVGKDDWIGLFAVGASNTAPVTKGSWYRAAESGGVLEWTKPNVPSTPGWYEFRFFKGSGYTNVLGVSDAVTLIAEDGSSVDTSSPSPTPAGFVISSQPLTCGEFTHIAVVRRNQELMLLVNGVVTAPSLVPFPPQIADVPVLLGCGLKQ